MMVQGNRSLKPSSQAHVWAIAKEAIQATEDGEYFYAIQIDDNSGDNKWMCHGFTPIPAWRSSNVGFFGYEDAACTLMPGCDSQTTASRSSRPAAKRCAAASVSSSLS